MAPFIPPTVPAHTWHISLGFTAYLGVVLFVICHAVGQPIIISCLWYLIDVYLSCVIAIVKMLYILHTTFCDLHGRHSPFPRSPYPILRLMLQAVLFLVLPLCSKISSWWSHGLVATTYIYITMTVSWWLHLAMLCTHM